MVTDVLGHKHCQASDQRAALLVPRLDFHPCNSGAGSSASPLSRPANHDLPFSNWSLTKLADFFGPPRGGRCLTRH